MKLTELVTKALGDNSEISFGRAASGLTLCFCLGWDSAFVWFAMRHLDFGHMTVHDVLPSASALIAQAGFCTIFYGVNKAKSAWDSSQGVSPENGQK